MSGAPISRIVHYRIRSDTGTVDATPTWLAAEDTSAVITPGTAFRIRISVENTGTAADTITQPDTTTGIGRFNEGTARAFASVSNVFNGADASTSVDATNVTVQRLTSGTGVFATGTAGYDENETLSTAITNGNFTEVEFGVLATGGVGTSGVGGGESWRFQLGGLTNASAQIPTFTTANTDGTAFSHGNVLLGTSQKIADSATISTSTAAATSANDLIVVVVTCDNAGSADGDNSDISGVTIDGTAAVKAVEFSNAQGSAQAGVTTSIWYKQFAAAKTSGKTVTATFTTATTSGDCCTMQARTFGVSGGATVSVEATNSAATNAVANPASLDCTTSNIECLRIAAHGGEWGPATATTINTKFSGVEWSPWPINGSAVRSTGTAAATDQCCVVEANISTGTGKASAPNQMTGGSACDWASAYVAFKVPSAAAVTYIDYSPGAEILTKRVPIGY